jgi:trimethylamine--corrinoid protein Co-methyltransferase
MTGATANASLMLHAGGWDEAGMVHCLCKLVVDAEQNLMMAKYAQGVTFDRLDEAMEAIRRVGPGGHFLGDSFTLKHFQDAFFAPTLLNYEAWEHWQANGSLTLPERAKQHAETLLANYRAPPIDAAVSDALHAFVEKRTSEISPKLG